MKSVTGAYFLTIKCIAMAWQAHTNITGQQQKQAFEIAAKQVKETTGSVDRLLERGGLESVECCKMIETASNISCYTEETIHADVLSGLCNWHFPYTEKEYWSYLSARTFIEVASKLQLAISFSW
jgi:hypothetical protein